jgi:SAM-dependent MidA family methyltransferase
MSQKEVKLSWRELNIAYNVDFKTVAQLAEQYGIDWTDMKAALRGYGFVVRKGEAKVAEPSKPYKVILIDTDKIVAEDSVASTVVTAQS